MRTKKVTKAQAEFVLREVAKWLGPRMGYEGSAPTGHDAAYCGEGPELRREWDWVHGSADAILLEGGPYDWAVECCWEVQQAVDASKTHRGQLFLEPYAGWALCIYREQD